MSLWLIVIAMGVITYALRLSLLGVLGRLEAPPLLSRALRFVPAAVLSAIILPDLLQPGGKLNLSLGNLRLLAGLLAMAVAWRTRSVVLTVAVGLAAFWVLQALLR